jgi:hypothetical protein
VINSKVQQQTTANTPLKSSLANCQSLCKDAGALLLRVCTHHDEGNSGETLQPTSSSSSSSNNNNSSNVAVCSWPDHSNVTQCVIITAAGTHHSIGWKTCAHHQLYRGNPLLTIRSC